MDRWYDPELGRFIQEDPIHSGVNDYVFADNDPVNGSDPSGACDGAGQLQAALLALESDVSYSWHCGDLAGVTITGHRDNGGFSTNFGNPNARGGGYGSSAPGGGDGGGSGTSAPSSTPTATPKWRSARCLSAGAGLGLAGLNTFAWFTGGGEAVFAARGAWKIGGALTRSIAEHGVAEATAGNLKLAGFETLFTAQAFGEHLDTSARVQAVAELFPVLDVASTLYTVIKSCH